jgi:hypothetical protein
MTGETAHPSWGTAHDFNQPTGWWQTAVVIAAVILLSAVPLLYP